MINLVNKFDSIGKAKEEVVFASFVAKQLYNHYKGAISIDDPERV
jgi:hypothetical protein